MIATTKTTGKVKEFSHHLLFMVVGLSLGFLVKQGWALYQQPPIFLSADTKPHFINTQHKVIVYTTEWCEYCKKVKQYLNANNIKFDNRDIYKINSELLELYNSLDYPGVPKIIVGDTIINGAYLNELKQELDKQSLLYNLK